MSRSLCYASVAHDLKKERTAMSLAADDQTVLICASWSDDAETLCSSFAPPEPLAEGLES